MRNLRKYLAVFVAVAIMLTAMIPAFAADTATSAPASMSDAKIAETLGMVVGQGNGVTDDYLATQPSKLQSAIMFLRLQGLEKDALAYTGAANFSDASKVEWAGGQAIMGYLKSKPELGFIGNPDGTFNPNATITAQQYYKILLVALGYKEDLGNGGDFKFADTVAFAASKGLSKAANVVNFTINDLSAATVETLKAKVKDGSKTLIQALVDAKAVDSAKAAAVGMIASSAAATSFDLTAKTAKSLDVKFNGTIADTSKVAFTVTRDAGIAVNLTAAWNNDKTEAVLSQATNLVSGQYTVAIKNGTTDLGNKNVTVEAEKIAKIELTSKQITRRSDSDGVAYYKVANQYGDDVTKLPIASNITWNSSLGTANGASVTADKGTLTLHKNDNPNPNVPTIYMGLLKDQQSVVVTAYDSDSNTVMNGTLNVSTTVGDIQSFKFLGLSNKDGKTALEKNTTAVFYLDYEAKDSNGNAVTDYDILHNSNAFRLSPGSASESTIAYAEVVQDPNDSHKALIQVKVPNNGIAGTQVISGVSITTGKADSFNVTVNEGSVLQQFTLQKPAQDVAVGDGFAEVPYIAMDSNGNALTDYSKIQGKVTFSGIDTSKVKEIQNPDGSYKLLMDFGTLKTTYTVSATVTTTTTVKMSTMSVTVKDAAAPKTIVGLDSNKFIPGLVYGAYTGDKIDKITINDQYDRKADLRYRSNKYSVTENNVTNDYYYFLVASVNSNDLPIVSVGGAYNGNNAAAVSSKVIVGNSSALKIYANTQTGSATVKLQLMRAATQADVANNVIPNGATVVDEKTFTFYNVDKKDISGYSIDNVDSVLYAGQNNTKLNSFNTWYNYTSNTSFGEYASDAKVHGKYNGMSVELNPADVLNYGVSDSSKFGSFVDNTLSGNDADRKVFAKYVDSDPYQGVLTAVVKGYQGVIQTATAKINSKNELAQAQSIGVDFNDPLTVATANDAQNINIRTFVQYGMSGDIFRVTSAYANSNFANKRIIKYSIDPAIVGATAGHKLADPRSDLYFYVADQYGKKGLAPASVNATVTRNDNNAVATLGYNTTTGVLSVTNGTLNNGDIITLTAYTGNGVSKSIKIYVDDSVNYDYSHR